MGKSFQPDGVNIRFSALYCQLKLKLWAFKAAIDRPTNSSARQLPIDRFWELTFGENSRVGKNVQKFGGDWDIHPYSFDPYFKNIGIQTMCNSSSKREAHHASKKKN